VPEPRTHYQLSFTARQAMVFFVVCLLALGLSYFFGLMTGLSDRPAPAAVRTPPTPAPSPGRVAAGGPPTPEGPFDAPEAGSRTRLAGEPTPGEATPPRVLKTFEDGGAEEPTNPPAPAPSPARVSTRAAAAAGPAPSAPTAGGLWVQVASLASPGEADALVRRLRRRGFHAQTFPAEASAKGRVFRVRVGPYRTEEDAARAADRLRRQERIRQTWVVREGR
jgi:cell division septation protein DedD